MIPEINPILGWVLVVLFLVIFTWCIFGAPKFIRKILWVLWYKKEFTLLCKNKIQLRSKGYININSYWRSVYIENGYYSTLNSLLESIDDVNKNNLEPNDYRTQEEKNFMEQYQNDMIHSKS